MLEVAAARGVDGSPALVPAPRAAPVALPVHPALHKLLPDGLRRGSTVGVSGSVSLLLALLGAASAEGSWCALVGFPPVSAEAAVEYDVHPSRLVLVPDPGTVPDPATRWTAAVGALLDAFDVVVARPPARLPAGDARRLAARVRMRQAVLVPYRIDSVDSADSAGAADWPDTDVRLTARPGRWYGPEDGYGRLRQRQVTVTAQGRGRAARARSVALWLPAMGGGVAAVPESIASVTELPARTG